MPTDLAEEHYAEHAEKPFFGELVTFLTRSPVFAMVVEGPDDNTWHLCRKLIGKTKVDDAQPGSIRGDLATTTAENLVHGSDGPESAEREIALWFRILSREIPVAGSVASTFPRKPGLVG